GVVYRARQLALDRVVALKMLLPGGSAAPERLGRFHAEAGALGRLQHPNVVPIYESGECQGRPYFTMEYVAGPNLAAVLAARPQAAHASARLLEVLARAMHAVHQTGLIHRDLKPANVLLAVGHDGEKSLLDFAVRSVSLLEHGVPKITDFGLAKDPT